jgi:hypothetical protein
MLPAVPLPGSQIQWEVQWCSSGSCSASPLSAALTAQAAAGASELTLAADARSTAQTMRAHDRGLDRGATVTDPRIPWLQLATRRCSSNTQPERTTLCRTTPTRSPSTRCTTWTPSPRTPPPRARSGAPAAWSPSSRLPASPPQRARPWYGGGGRAQLALHGCADRACALLQWCRSWQRGARLCMLPPMVMGWALHPVSCKRGQLPGGQLWQLPSGGISFGAMACAACGPALATCPTSMCCQRSRHSECNATSP